MARYLLTKKAKLEGYDRLASERDALATYAWHMANGHEPDAVETVDGRDPGESYTLALYGASRADGGTLVSTFRYPGQFASVTAKRFDEAYRACMAIPAGCHEYLPFKVAMDRLRQAQRGTQDAGCSRLNHAACAHV